ncbi:HAT1-like protein [Mya arenaria]|uniref:Histone acetyltransferase type B catalytic subunit n=1 Tax=Mya arenaria TaxID=6604 RepID=A0ABY7EEG5_MYAAR|nr:HAT1-like protein [Mya arenaria]
MHREVICTCAHQGIVPNSFEDYKCDANEVLKESIFGYKNLEIQMYYTAARLNTYLNIRYKDKVSPEKHEGLKPDDVIGSLAKEIPPGYYSNIDDFNGEKREFEIYKTDIECPGFREYHQRLQTFVLFFIDAASFIDVDDDRWSFYLLFEKYKSAGNTMYAIGGYMTVYNYYAYPSRHRPRIRAMEHSYSRHSTTVAMATQTYLTSQRLRDFVDARNCQKLKSFQPDKLKAGFDEDMVREARSKLKLNRRQIKRVYEILRLKVTNVNKKEEYTQYRLEIKRRLNIPFQKNGRDFEKLEKALMPDELSATLSCMTLQQRHQYLQKAFEELEEVYRHVINRLDMA